MIVKHHATRVMASLKRDIPGLRRILIARSDGLVFQDNGPERDHEAAAAIVSTVLGIAQRAAEANTLGGFQQTTVKATDGCLVVYAIDQTHVLAVVAEPSVNLVLLDRVALRLVGELATAETGGTALRVR
ncbi:MAG: roadblock/LC7 domain-containing protein [Janthinobacterium lividum]